MKLNTIVYNPLERTLQVINLVANAIKDALMTIGHYNTGSSQDKNYKF